jgi:FkbM family methyltransferase
MNYNFPSPLVEIDLPWNKQHRSILIPRNEVFRFRNIFIGHEYRIPQDFIPSGPVTIVDIGANIGLFTLYMRSIKCDSTIFCFEPVPDTLALLRHNIADQNDIHVFPVALSDHATMATMTLHPKNTGENSFKAECPASNDAAKVQVQVLDAGTIFSQIGLTYIDIVKIDTEGCEVEILESLWRYIPYIGILMIEYHSDADRRKIDQLLPGHLMMSATIGSIGLGTVRYINSRLTGNSFSFAREARAAAR